MKKKPKVGLRRRVEARASADDVYTLEAVVRLTEIPRNEIVVFCRQGVISPLDGPREEEWQFDATAIHALRRLAYLRSQFGLNRTGAQVVASLLDEIEQLRAEVRFLRGR